MNNDQEINRKIKQAFEHATPDILDSVLADCNEQKGIRPMTTKYSPSGSRIKSFLTVAAALLLIFGGLTGLRTYQTNHSIVSTITLDVNPSIEIQVNQKERVLAVIPRNEDAKIIVGDMDFSGSSLDVTVNALIGSMLRNGYLSELSNSILISVDGKNPAESAALQAKLSDEINKLLQTEAFSGAVLSQTITTDDETQTLADTYGITVGKAQLIKQIIASHPTHSFDELVSLSINELNLISSSSSAPLKQVDSVGTASVKAYIGEDNAWAIALTHARLTAADISDLHMDMDYELGAFVYELEFHCGDHDYEYYIHATNGAVVAHDKERCDKKHDHDEHHHGPYDVMPIPSTSVITDAEAQRIALAHAGASADQIYDYSCELDEDDGILVYDIEFSQKGYDYNYEIDAVTGKVVKWDREKDDDVAR